MKGLHIPEYRPGPRWLPAEDMERFTPDNVFLSPGWRRHWKSPGWPVYLELVDRGARMGFVTIRDLWLPGVFRQWEVVAEPDLLEGELDQSATLEALLELARYNRVDLVQSFFNMARWTDPGVRDKVTAEGGYCQEFGTYIVKTSTDEEEIASSLHKMLRRLLRKSHRIGLRVKEGLEPGEFWELLDETYRKGGKICPHSRRYIHEFLSSPAVPMVSVAVRSASGRLEAAVVVPYDGRRGYYLHGGTRKDVAPGASVAAHVKAMQVLAEKGVPLYDLGGARRSTTDQRLAGIFKFKSRFGGEFEDCVRWRLGLTLRGKIVASRLPG